MAISSRAFKDAIYDQLARIGKAVASPRRLELLDLLCQAPRTVEELARRSGQSTANASHHLQVLRAARLVETEKQGPFVRYSLADERVCEFYLSLRTLAGSRLAEVERVTREYLESRGTMEAIDRSTLLERVHTGRVTVIDVRPVEEYEAGHIPGALCVPLEELEARLVEIPSSGEVVAYCRGPYCVLAVKAVLMLRKNGFTAVRLEDGVPDWHRRGLEVTTGREP
ncbi:MAG: ArsR family transcriptional regulator [Deltaproteobacteria bacterium]|nr:ArsR family transcriptional regulator [Deltaproteobacteria bacterium]